MPNLIVVRIVPQTPVDSGTFASYLSNNGGLQITAFDLSFSSPTSGQNVGSASYVAPAAGTPSPTSATAPPLPPPVETPPSYPAGITNGIIQQIDLIPAVPLGDHAYFQIESVATAVIEIPSPPSGAFENLRLVAQWGTGAGAQAIPVTQDYYDVPLAPGPTPDPNTWASLTPSLYLSIPAPAAAGGTTFSMPSDGTAPSFDSLKTAIQGVLNVDPGGALPDLGKLNLDQCRNIAYEIIWSQQAPIPTPPPTDPIENLYTNPPNNGVLLNGTNPNQWEGDREQFEARLTGYYAIANARADRLTSYVFSFVAAVACEETSLAATQVLLEFPVNPAGANSAEAELILTGLGSPAANFGVPAAYFYALAATMPSSMTPTQRYSLAVGDSLPHVLAELTSALNAQVVTDSEAFVTSGPAAINAAQAARRLGALKVPAASTTPTLALTAALQPLVTQWLAFASTDPSPSSESYQPSDDVTGFWPNAATTQAPAFLALVLCVLTQGFQIPAPTSAPLADEITLLLLNPAAAPGTPTVATLAAVTNSQWTQFFNSNPTWLPPFTQPGNTAAQIANFIRYFQKLFSVTDAGPAGEINYVTTSDTPSGAVLPFASTAGIVAGMSVSGTNIPAGTTVLGPPTPPTPTSVTLSNAVAGDVPAGTNIKFTANYTGAGPSGLPLLQAPSTDWLTACLGFYQATPFQFGSGFNLTNLQAAAAQVFQNDPEAQTWLVNALVTIDALYQILGKVVPAIAANLEFSVVEALYALGFTSAADVTELSGTEFQQALTGTVAYDSAADLYKAAQTISPAPPEGSSCGAFQPINPDGSLTNCIPAPCRSPLGPIAYLNEMLQVSPRATCGNPLAAPAEGQSTLGSVMAQRRGTLGTLAASCANLETPLPLIDIVNECLEFLGSVVSPTNGTVYNTSADAVAGHLLCKDECPTEKSDACVCHDPATLLGALPEYSTPGTPALSSKPLESNQAVEPQVYNNLKAEFSSCCLPYSQALDVCRTYLRHFRTCRFEVMRTFRKCITEFVLDPANEPAGFENHLWRYPVRIDTAIEYLGITPEEYQGLFNGASPKPCGPPQDTRNPDQVRPEPWQLYGFGPNDRQRESWTQVVIQLPEFLKRTCLTYCEFLELWKSQFVVFTDGGERGEEFPDCEPCCLEKHWLQFPVSPVPGQPTAGQPIPSQPVEGQPVSSQPPPGQPVAIPGTEEQWLYQLAIFIRLWHKLKDVCGAEYDFTQLRDICDVLQLFTGNGLNPDFIRQLAAFQILRDQFTLTLADPADRPTAQAIDADRTQLLSLWVGESAAEWPWAVKQLIEGIEHQAKCRSKCDHRPPEFAKALASNLDELSLLAGFNPTAPADTWHALPTHTLRFAEVLSKIYASHFRLDEIFYLFTAGAQSEAGNVFPLQEEDEALEFPLSLPDDEPQYSLWKLRHELLEACVSEEDVCCWSWKRIEDSLRKEFGYAAADLLLFGRHFFPDTLQSSGYMVDAQQRRYSTSLAPADTTPGMWNNPPEGPFQYDAAAAALSIQLPLADEAVIEQLERVQQLNSHEQNAVQDLYFQPRATLAAFAFLFTDFVEAQERLIQEREECERWNYFRQQFALCRLRCQILAEHLAAHVDSATNQNCPDGVGEAFIVLSNLFADENRAANWENDSGKTPSVTWARPNGGAFAALLGLTGTGLLREFTPEGGSVIWRDVCDPLKGFGWERNSKNCPLPTILPSLGLTLTAAQLQNVSIRNGLAADGVSGAWLGGAQGFAVKWTGALLIERDGIYEFCAGGPTPEGERPDLKDAEHRQWRVTLTRDQKTRVLLNHNWPGQTGRTMSCPHLKCGAYDIIVEFSQPSPAFLDKEECRQHTGFQLKYIGPDSCDKLVEIPHNRLFRVLKDLKQESQDRDSGPIYQDLGYGIAGLAAGANSFLNGYYTSSLRDIRRTYQRAFKALLFAHRFPLSAKCREDGHSELGFLLAHPDNFAGLAYYRPSGGTNVFDQHAANFDFNFLPLEDNYYPPTPAEDSRTQPSMQQSRAMFDWWERIFDYVHVRNEVRSECGCALWSLFAEAVEKQPADPGYLLRHMGASERDWPIDLRYYQDQDNPPYSVSSSDLADDRWVVRVWHAERLVRGLLQGLKAKDAASARPDLWASLDPSALVAGETATGNANLSAFLCDGCFENGLPRRYDDVRNLNDGLRDRGRRALIAYLCEMNRVALPWSAGQFAQEARDLSDLLLLDVEAGLCEKASRIEEAISSAQNFIRRARLGLEPSWPVTRDFALMWDRHFASFHVWQACKRRHLYKENWIEWDELKKARRIEAFRFLETQLRSDALTIAAPGGLEWWPDERPPGHRGIDLLQKLEPDKTRLLTEPREGLNLLATPERDARPSWLTMVQTNAPQNTPAPSCGTTSLPSWMEAAIRLGRRFYRIAAAGVPPASSGFEPHRNRHTEMCCVECGYKHPALVDEYYFWLAEGAFYSEPPNSQLNSQQTGSTGSPDDYQYGFQDDFYSQAQQQSGWQDPTQLPQLLAWNSSPLVRLAWCQVHNGEFQQPRISSEGVAVKSISDADLAFVGRTADSLTFSVSNPAIPSPPPVVKDTSAPGFRYDLATDSAVVVPLVSAPPGSLVPYPGGLPCYPYFVYNTPSVHLLPLSFFSPAIMVAPTLRAHCSFEAALKWYRLAFDPLQRDCSWVHCDEIAQRSAPGVNNPAGAPAQGAISGPTDQNGSANGACCDSADVSEAVARNRSIVLHYLETLREWGDAAMRRNSPEHFQHARLLFDTIELILGKAAPVAPACGASESTNCGQLCSGLCAAKSSAPGPLRRYPGPAEFDSCLSQCVPSA